MNHSAVKPGAIDSEIKADAHQRHNGFIVFCETNLRYEKGFRAWIFLGPYLLGALCLEMMIPESAKGTPVLGLWLGFLAYLVLFPLVWRRILTLIPFKRGTPVLPLR